jgi:hypothetical protein
MLSDVFFFRPEAEGPAMTVRTVRQVDGQDIKTAAMRIEEALALPPGQRTQKLRALADAGAMYNLGNLQRNFNEPTVALTFAAADYQPRFRFSLDGMESADGQTLRRVAFSEVEHPTIIRDGRSGERRARFRPALDNGRRHHHADRAAPQETGRRGDDTRGVPRGAQARHHGAGDDG